MTIYGQGLSDDQVLLALFAFVACVAWVVVLGSRRSRLQAVRSPTMVRPILGDGSVEPRGTPEYYECHVTCQGDPSLVRAYVEAMGWTFSAIDGDIVMGAGTKCYATHHYNARMERAVVVGNLEWAAQRLRFTGVVAVLREKVELVVHDRRHHT